MPRMTFRRGGAVLATIVCLGGVLVGCTTPPDPTTSVTVDLGEGRVVTVTGPAGSSLTAHADSQTGAAIPDAVNFPLGALAISVSGIEPGSVVSVSLTSSTPFDSVYKLIDGAWVEFLDDGATGAVLVDATTATLRLRDGGRGDADGAADGVIVDPVALATAWLADGCYRTPSITTAIGLRYQGPPGATSQAVAVLETEGPCTGIDDSTQFKIVRSSSYFGAITQCVAIGFTKASAIGPYTGDLGPDPWPHEPFIGMPADAWLCLAPM